VRSLKVIGVFRALFNYFCRCAEFSYTLPAVKKTGWYWVYLLGYDAASLGLPVTLRHPGQTEAPATSLRIATNSLGWSLGFWRWCVTFEILHYSDLAHRPAFKMKTKIQRFEDRTPPPPPRQKSNGKFNWVGPHVQNPGVLPMGSKAGPNLNVLLCSVCFIKT
jgi:hypothetical protein